MFDFVACTIYFFAMFFRLLSIFFKSETAFQASKIILAVDFTIWSIRLLQVTLISKNLGPKLIMIDRMMHDLVFFVVLIAIFVFTFAITTQATMYSNNEPSFMMIKKLFDKAYWPIYGDLRILEEINLIDSNCSDQTCPSVSGSTFSYAFLAIYIVLSNVLLINLLTAMFSSTYEFVHDNRDKIWRIYRYYLVFEYQYRSPFVPPFNLIGYLIYFIKYMKKNLKKTKLKSDEEINQEALALENAFAQEFFRNKRKVENESLENRVKTNTIKLDYIEQKLAEMAKDKAELLNAIMNMRENKEQPNATQNQQ